MRTIPHTINTVIYPLKITQWAKEDQPQEKLFNQGPEILSDAELMAVIIRSGKPGLNAVELARSLLQLFGGLHALTEIPATRLNSINGIGAAKAAQLCAAFELARRIHSVPLNPQLKVTEPEIVSPLPRVGRSKVVYGLVC